jgi:hypothetical protein
MYRSTGGTSIEVLITFQPYLISVFENEIAHYLLNMCGIGTNIEYLLDKCGIRAEQVLGSRNGGKGGRNKHRCMHGIRIPNPNSLALILGS